MIIKFQIVSFCKAKQDVEAPNKYQLVTKMEVQDDGGFFLLIALRSPWYQRMSGLKAQRTNPSNLPVIHQHCQVLPSRCIQKTHSESQGHTQCPRESSIHYAISALLKWDAPERHCSGHVPVLTFLQLGKKRKQAWTSTAKVRRCSFRMRNNYANKETHT